MSFGTWKVRDLYRVGSISVAVKELARYKLGLVGVLEVRWDKWGHGNSRGLYFFLCKRIRKSSNGNRISFTPQNSINS